MRARRGPDELPLPREPINDGHTEGRAAPTMPGQGTPEPTRFDAAFREISRRSVGGGPKATGADAITFRGHLGFGTVYLTSRVRLIERNESFYTPSNMRLRDSHVGRGGHWVEITIHGECSDAELALITRLARAADARPVVVRRARR